MEIVLGRDDLSTAAEKAALAAGTTLDRIDVRPVHKASRKFVNGDSVDLCELAVVTLLQAAAYDKPVVLLPVTTLGRFQHQTLVTCSDNLTVDAIEGHSVGVRSWSQTTGVWMRGFLTEQYGVDLRKVHWAVYEDGHIDEYTDPQWIQRAPAGSVLQTDFLEGRLDYGVMGNELPTDDRIRTAIPRAERVALEWSAQKGFAPINHVMAVSTPAARQHSAAICAIYDALRDATATSSEHGAVDLNPVGFEALRAPISQAAAYALEQDVIPRPVEFDELVDRSCAALDVPPSRLDGRNQGDK